MVFYGVGIDYPVLFEQLKPAPSRLLLVQETQSKKKPEDGHLSVSRPALRRSVTFVTDPRAAPC